MTSTWRGPSARDGGPDSQGAETDENQLDLFEILPRADARAEQPFAVGGGSFVLELRPGESRLVETPVVGLDNPEPATPGVLALGNVETIVGPGAAREASDSDDLRRLEESIRWLMSAGTVPLPRTGPLRPAIGPSALDLPDDEALLLDPDTLFPPRAPRRSNSVAVGAAKILLVSAIVAPTAYFTASWLQFPGAAAPSEPAAVAALETPAAVSGEQVAALAPAPSVPTPPDPAPVIPAPAAAPVVPDRVDVPPAQQPDLAASPPPAGRAATMAVATFEGAPATTAKAPEPPPAAAAQLGDSVSAPMPALLPAKPALRHEEIAMMVERGRVLFEAGDVAAARLFFRRAANAGDAAAAIAMGATYDPDVLTQRFIRGIEGDPQEAQRWYERARDMGQRVELAERR
jgi:hypothetical protein